MRDLDSTDRNDNLEALLRRVDEAREAIGRMPERHPYGNLDGIDKGHRPTMKVLEVALAAGKTEWELATILIRGVVPKVVEYRRRALERDVAAYEMLRDFLDDPDSIFFSVDDLYFDTYLGSALQALREAFDGMGVLEAVRPLFCALDGGLCPDEWGPRLAEAVLDAIRASSSDAPVSVKLATGS